MACWQEDGRWAVRASRPVARDEIYVRLAPRLASGSSGGVVETSDLGDMGARLGVGGVSHVVAAEDGQDPVGCVLLFENPDQGRLRAMTAVDGVLELAELAALAGQLLRAERRAGGLEAITRENTLLRERRRLASMTHEGITQVLTNVAIQLEVLDQFLEHPETAREMARSSRTAVLEALDSLRGAIFELGPGPEWRDLSTGLKRYTADFGARWGLDVSCSVEGRAREVSADVLALAFAFVQESLTNLRRHAHTSEGQVILRFEPTGFVLSVCDQGVGFDPGESRNQRFRQHQGLALTEARARLMGARFEVRAAPGYGTCISLRSPG